MKQIKEYHHFKPHLITREDRVSQTERAVHDLLIESSLTDAERQSSVCWELKHYASTAQFARILARKRGLPVDICSVGMMLHDISSMVSGDYKEHAHRGASIAADLLREVGGFNNEELDQIYRLIYHHSDKHIWSDDPIEEFGKDVDVLDCFLYEGAFDFYLGNKPLHVFVGYLERAKRVWKELELPNDLRFGILDGYGDRWFSSLGGPVDATCEAAIDELIREKQPLELRPPAFCLVRSGGAMQTHGCKAAWKAYTRRVSERQGLSSPTTNFLSQLLPGNQTDGERPESDRHPPTGLEQKEMWDFLAAGTVNNPHAVLVWPVVDIYEQLCGKRMKNRLIELGIKMEEEEL